MPRPLPDRVRRRALSDQGAVHPADGVSNPAEWIEIVEGRTKRFGSASFVSAERRPSISDCEQRRREEKIGTVQLSDPFVHMISIRRRRLGNRSLGRTPRRLHCGRSASQRDCLARTGSPGREPKPTNTSVDIVIRVKDQHILTLVEAVCQADLTQSGLSFTSHTC